MKHRRRRATAFLTLVLLLQPTLLAGQTRCAGAVGTVAGRHDSTSTQSDGLAANSAAMEMEMAAGGGVTQPTATTDQSPTPATDCEGNGPGEPCGGRDIPHDCATMSGCVSPPMTMTVVVRQPDLPATPTRTPAPFALLDSTTACPDTPPPRR